MENPNPTFFQKSHDEYIQMTNSEMIFAVGFAEGKGVRQDFENFLRQDERTATKLEAILKLLKPLRKTGKND
jgi:hypothetical protein